jgi:hypothetical protein
VAEKFEAIVSLGAINTRYRHTAQFLASTGTMVYAERVRLPSRRNPLAPEFTVVYHEAVPNEASGSLLDEIMREAARQQLAVALQAEVSACQGHDRQLTRPA